jgi:hypothetical protein
VAESVRWHLVNSPDTAWIDEDIRADDAALARRFRSTERVGGELAVAVAETAARGRGVGVSAVPSGRRPVRAQRSFCWSGRCYAPGGGAEASVVSH